MHGFLAFLIEMCSLYISAEKYSGVTPEKFLQRQSQKAGESSNPLENLDCKLVCFLPDLCNIYELI